MNEKTTTAFFYGRVIVPACFLIQGVGIGTYVSFGVFIKPLLAEFGWSRATVSGASSLALLLMGVLGILAGNLNDRFGPRIIMAVTGLLYGAGHMLLSQLNSVWQLYLFYGLIAGVGLSSIDVIALTTTARWFVRRRGMMTGFIKVGTGTGQMLMPLATGLLILNFGWRRAFMVLGITAVVFICGAGQLLRRDPGQMGQMPDGDGGPTAGTAVAPAGGLSLREAIGRGPFYVVCLINVLVIGSLFTVLVHIVPHASDMGLEPMKAAGVLSTIGGVSILGRISTGIIIDRIGTRKSMLLCFILLLISLTWLQFADRMWMLYLFAAVYGIAHGGFFTSISPLVAELFGLTSHGVLVGIVVFSGTLGGAIGPFLAGHAFDLTHSYQWVFLALTVAATAGLILTLFLRPAVQARR